MALPPGFPFTQTALRAYLECPYRFRLRYLERVPWSGLPPDPEGEAAVERGRLFHELARQHFLGLDVTGQAAAQGAGAQGAGARGEETRDWWLALRDTPPDLAAYPRHFPEAGLSVPLGSYRLAARYDLLAVGEERALIVDWKTGADLPPRAVLAGDIQTRVYLYVLADGGATYHAGRPLPPAALGLLYWHPRGPQQVQLSYSAARQAADGAFLEGLVQEIASREPEELRPTAGAAACGHCAYTALCGTSAGQAPEWEEEDLAPEAEGWEGV